MDASADNTARTAIRESLRASLDSTIEMRIDRYLEVGHQGIVPGHHFASASSECINLYRDGYLLSVVMVYRDALPRWVRHNGYRNGLLGYQHSNG
ncbi:MAG: hypothetical protein Q7J82_03840 [Coriobacteriia bacterium]|nr:hypothetical protein [Coriobacteriia bacterium]